MGQECNSKSFLVIFFMCRIHSQMLHVGKTIILYLPAAEIALILFLKWSQQLLHYGSQLANSCNIAFCHSIVRMLCCSVGIVSGHYAYGG